MSLTASILKQIASLGYAVTIHRMTGGISLSGRELPVPDFYVEMHAVQLSDPDQQHIARVEGEGLDVDYRCAVELALLVGIDIEDG